MKTHFISIFDKNHLARAVACRESLQEFMPDARMTWLCLDGAAFEAAGELALANTSLLHPEDLHDPELLAARPTRTQPEFASTCKPAFLLHIMKSGRVGPGDLLVFLDPDFGAYDALGGFFARTAAAGSICITPHRFSHGRESEAGAKGYYNAGIVCFRNDESARTCLEKWRAQCIEWCYLRYEDGKIGDQGYMTDWSQKYQRVYDIPDKGVNLANWNISNYTIKTLGNDRFTIDGEPLLLHHFHGLKIYFDRSGVLQAYPITAPHAAIYEVYLRRLRRAYAALQRLHPEWAYGTAERLSWARRLKQCVSRFVA